MDVILFVLKWLAISFFAVSVIHVLILKFVRVNRTPLMLFRCRQQRKRGEAVRLHHQWMPLDEIPTDFKTAVWVAEDGLFISHFGFDFLKLFKGLMVFIHKRSEFKKSFFGISTISQQTAKNVFLWPNRSLFRKMLEAYYTILIELLWGKQRIMEVYLNCIEMGDGIYGVYAAAKEHYHCEPKELTREQIANIVTCLPNPINYQCTNIFYPLLLESKKRILMGMEETTFPPRKHFAKVQFLHRWHTLKQILHI